MCSEELEGWWERTLGDGAGRSNPSAGAKRCSPRIPAGNRSLSGAPELSAACFNTKCVKIQPCLTPGDGKALERACRQGKKLWRVISHNIMTYSRGSDFIPAVEEVQGNQECLGMLRAFPPPSCSMFPVWRSGSLCWDLNPNPALDAPGWKRRVGAQGCLWGLSLIQEHPGAPLPFGPAAGSGKRIPAAAFPDGFPGGGRPGVRAWRAWEASGCWIGETAHP